MQLPVKDSVSNIKQFLLSQYFYDGLKITFGVVLPSIICFQFGHLEIGITMSLGALFISITDNPGAIIHKRNAMMITNGLMFLMALIIGFTNSNAYVLAIEITFFCFFLSMFTVYGARASAIGIALLIVMVIGIDQHLPAEATVIHALMLLTGGVWYMLFSMLLTQVVPYRPAEQTLGECIQEVADFIKIKAEFYDPKTDLQENSQKLIDQQILVNQQQENVREILFRTRKLLKDSSAQGNILIMTFIDLIDLYEHAMESHINYEEIHHLYGGKSVLFHLKNTIKNLGKELDYIGKCIHNRQVPHKFPMTSDLLIGLKAQIDILDKQEINTVVLKKILINLRNMNQRVEQIYGYQKSKTKVPANRKNEFKLFTTHQSFDWKILRENLSFKSNVFRHSFRVALVCLIAFIFARNFYTGNFSYWILLTIIVILKPAFSQTKKRNYDRIIGTVAGGLLGILILQWIEDQTTRFWILLLFMLLSYSFSRLRYVVSVFFMTPFILIMYSFIGHNNDMLILKERVIDTFIGAGIATLASYFILPSWESFQIRNMMSELVLKNINYFNKVINYRNEDYPTQVAHRLSRKEMYVAASNLASAFQRMLNEPKRKRQYVNEVNKFILLNNILAANIAAIFNILKEQPEYSETQIREFRKVYSALKESYFNFSAKTTDIEFNFNSSENEQPELQDLLQKMLQTAVELKKLSAKFEK